MIGWVFLGLLFVIFVSCRLFTPRKKAIFVMPILSLAVWYGYEYYLAHYRKDLWLRADLFLIIPLEIAIFVIAIRRYKESAPS